MPTYLPNDATIEIDDLVINNAFFVSMKKESYSGDIQDVSGGLHSRNQIGLRSGTVKILIIMTAEEYEKHQPQLQGLILPRNHTVKYYDQPGELTHHQEFIFTSAERKLIDYGAFVATFFTAQTSGAPILDGLFEVQAR